MLSGELAVHQRLPVVVRLQVLFHCKLRLETGAGFAAGAEEVITANVPRATGVRVKFL